MNQYHDPVEFAQSVLGFEPTDEQIKYLTGEIPIPDEAVEEWHNLKHILSRVGLTDTLIEKDPEFVFGDRVSVPQQKTDIKNPKTHTYQQNAKFKNCVIFLLVKCDKLLGLL